MTAITANGPRDPFFFCGSSAYSDVSKSVTRKLGDLLEHRFESARHLGIKQSLNALDEARMEASRPGWDGYDGCPISASAFQRASEFLLSYPIDLPAPDVFPENDGTVGFEWHRGPSKTFAIDIASDGVITYAGLFANGAKKHGVERMDGAVPDEIVRTIRRLYAE